MFIYQKMGEFIYLKKYFWFLKPIIVLSFFMLFSGCAPGDAQFTNETPAGFWFGLWHGMISAVTLILGIFYDTVKVYEVQNSGGWYDFGFLLGVSSVWGGAHKGASAKKKKSCFDDPEWKDIEEKLENKFYEKCKEWASEEKDKEWDDIAKKVEKKIKRKVKEWAEKE